MTTMQHKTLASDMRKFLNTLLVFFGFFVLNLCVLSGIEQARATSGRSLDCADSGCLIGVAKGLNFNTTADQVIHLRCDRFVVRRVVVTNASASLTLAVGGIYTAPNKGGVAAVPATQVYSALTTSGKFVDLALNAVLSTTVANTNTAYFSLTTPQGSAATADLFVFGDDVDRD